MNNISRICCCLLVFCLLCTACSQSDGSVSPTPSNEIQNPVTASPVPTQEVITENEAKTAESDDSDTPDNNESASLSDEEKLAQWKKWYRVNQLATQREQLERVAKNIKPATIDKGYLENMYQFVENSTSKIITESTENNCLYAPFSFYLSLSEFYEMASGEAKDELRNVLFPSNSMDNEGYLKNSIEWLMYSHWIRDVGWNISSGRFDANNSLWLSDKFSFDYDKTAYFKDNYLTDVFRGDFGSTDFQNQMYYWQYENTNYSMTPDYDEAHAVLDDCSIASINTMDYHDSWVFPFESAGTGSFYTSEGEEVTCDFIKKTLGGYMTFGSDYSAVYLPLQELNYMYVILPDEGTSVYDLINRSGFLSDFIHAKVNETNPINSTTDSGKIVVTLPKFSIENKLDLTATSKELGANKIFEKGVRAFVEFANEDTYIGRFNQSNKIKVDEKGCSTNNYSTSGAGQGGPPKNLDTEFVVNRPFIFIMVKDQIPFLVGVVVNPTL